jgi:hypothetical protein
LEERAEQVSLMGTIYRKASSVCVWLGSDNDVDNDAVSILKTMTFTQGAQNRLEDFDRMDHMLQFFARSWWDRLRVVQEVALGQHIVFQQGSKS